MKTNNTYSRYLKAVKSLLAKKRDEDVLALYMCDRVIRDDHQNELFKFQCKMELIVRGYRPYSVLGKKIAFVKKEVV